MVRSGATGSAYRSWTPFVLVAVVVGVALMSSATPSPLYVDYQESWGTSGTMITVVYAVYALAVLIPLLFLGRLSDAIGRRPVVMAGLALVGASMGLLVVAPDVAWLIVARIVQGIGVGLVTSSAGAAPGELHPRRDARVGALVNSSTLNFGIAAGVLLAGAVATWSPAPLVHPYLVIAVASAVLLVAVPVVVPETAGFGPAGLRDAVRPQRISVPPSIRPTFALASVCVLVSWSVGGVFLGLGGALTREMVGRSDYLLTGLVVAFLQGAAALAQLGWNLRAGSWSWRSGVTVGVVTLIAGLVAASLAVEAGSIVGLTAAAAVVGIGMGLLFLMGSVLAARDVPDGVRGEVISAFFVVAYVALGIPAVLAAFLAEIIGLGAAYHLLAAAVGLTAVGALITVKRSVSR